MSAIDFAYEVLEMQQELVSLRREVRRLQNIEADRDRLLRESIAHSQKMMGGMLKLCLVPGVGEAVAKHAAENPVTTLTP